MDEQERDQMIKETHDKVNTIWSVLLCVPNTSNGGLVKKVGEICVSHYRLKKNFYILVGILVGSGVVAGGVWRIFGG